MTDNEWVLCYHKQRLVGIVYCFSFKIHALKITQQLTVLQSTHDLQHQTHSFTSDRNNQPNTNIVLGCQIG